MKRATTLSLLLLLGCAGRIPVSAPAAEAAALAEAGALILPNDNRRPAGRLEGGVLTLRLEARDGTWYPDGPEGLARSVAAFAEEGGPLQNPGPLIRVPMGTEVRVRVRNSLGVPLTLYGLAERRGVQADTFRIEPGGGREMRFPASAPGLYYYAGMTEEQGDVLLEDAAHPVFRRTGSDSQLNGVIVVDPPGTTQPAGDRIFLISWLTIKDPTSPSGFGPASTMAINGLSWPHTERFDVAQGDSLHWRWVSLTAPPHPMHLHGFYFRVDARGDGAQYTTYAPEQRRLAVTETLRSGETMAIAWSPTRPGNWLFHCHTARHLSSYQAIVRDRRMPASAGSSPHGAHAAQHSDQAPHMQRLVLGIRVRPREASPPPAREVGEARALRLLIRSRPGVYGEYAGYGYVLGGSSGEPDPSAFSAPGPTLVLEKDRPVAITVVNQSHEPAAVHWHGIELESFPDGVPGWSGSEGNLLPAIAPRDSLTVRFTPPRAGTFMYHSHFNELQQISSGLYGAILVLEPSRRHDPETDRVLLFSDDGPTLNSEHGPFAPALLNGQAQPEPMELRAGVTYRFRLINIRSDYAVALGLFDGEHPVEWRAIARDGADLPAAQATLRPARLLLPNGEIHDFEFTPRAPGELRLRFGFRPGFRPAHIPVPGPAVVVVRVR